MPFHSRRRFAAVPRSVLVAAVAALVSCTDAATVMLKFKGELRIIITLFFFLSKFFSSSYFSPPLFIVYLPDVRRFPSPPSPLGCDDDDYDFTIGAPRRTRGTVRTVARRLRDDVCVRVRRPPARRPTSTHVVDPPPPPLPPPRQPVVAYLRFFF